MTCSLLYLFSVVRGNIFLLLCLSLYAFLQQISAINGTQLNNYQYAVIYFIAFAVPASGWIAAQLIERNISILYNRQFISNAAFIIAVALCLQSGKFVDFLISGIEAAKGKSHLELTGVLVNTANSALKCAAVVACSLLVLVSLVEVPFIWFCSALGFTQKAEISFAGLRPAIFFVIFIYAFDLIVGYISFRLWPSLF